MPGVNRTSGIGPTENNSGNIILVAKFEGDKSDHLGLLCVTREMKAKKITVMEEN